MAKTLGRVKEEILGVTAVLGAVYLMLCLVSYSAWDPSVLTYTRTRAGNYGGLVGAYLADILMSGIGFSSYLLPLFLLAYGVRRFFGKEGRRIYALGAALLVLSSSLMTALMASTFMRGADVKPGGIAGAFLSTGLRDLLSLPGAFIVSLSVLFSAVILLTPVSFASFSWKRRGISSLPQDRPPEPGVIEEEVLLKGPEKRRPEPLLVEPVHRPEPEAAAAPAGDMPRIRTEPREGYLIPPVDLLTAYDTSALRPSKEEFLSNSDLLESKLRDFDVHGKITHVHPGPVVTMYEFEPAPGVKINRVVTLADDLALSLKAQSLRVSPIPGKATIGIEVPNRQREVVSFRELVTAEPFRKSTSKLTLALGKDIFGTPIVADLTKMPHLLVAGATGAGKSVSMNSMVMSILYKASPKEVKMLMIDPKLLELSMYEDIPHLISPVITGPKQAAEALRKMVFEMERRYRLLAERGARNIESYNRNSPPGEQMPFVVIFIDELADLMFASSREVEDSITRLAQMARAAGIHLIIATQRPSVDVITGIIKANFPARISFQVFSKIDSRTILDTQGAEQLLGKGDMLFLLPGSRIIRVHGALVTEPEITAVTGFVKSQGKPDYSAFDSMPAEAPAPEESLEERDEVYQKALEFADSVGEVSISALQRRFKIGYNRAARIMETMEDDGLVGPPKGAGKPREFLRRSL